MYSDPLYVWIRWLFWGTGTVLTAPLVVSMWRRGLQRRFPAFFLLLVWSIPRFLIAFYVHTSGYYKTYFVLHYACEAVESVILLFVAAELYRSMFGELKGVYRLGQLFFRWSAAVMFLAAATAAAARGHSDLDRLFAALTAFDIGCKLLVGGVVFLLFIFCSYFGLPWSRYSLGIAAGIALYMIVGIFARSIFAIFGLVAGATKSIIDDAARFAMTLIWVTYLRYAERGVVPTFRTPNHSLDRWNSALQELLAR